jgi:hypothetical protein
MVPPKAFEGDSFGSIARESGRNRFKGDQIPDVSPMRGVT